MFKKRAEIWYKWCQGKAELYSKHFAFPGQQVLLLIFFSYLKACFPFFSVCLFMEFRIKIKISDLILQLHLLQLILARKCFAYKLSRFCLCRFCFLFRKMVKIVQKQNSNRNYSRLSKCCFSTQFAFLWYCTLGCLNAKNRSTVLVRI